LVLRLEGDRLTRAERQRVADQVRHILAIERRVRQIDGGARFQFPNAAIEPHLRHGETRELLGRRQRKAWNLARSGRLGGCAVPILRRDAYHLGREVPPCFGTALVIEPLRRSQEQGVRSHVDAAEGRPRPLAGFDRSTAQAEHHHHGVQTHGGAEVGMHELPRREEQVPLLPAGADAKRSTDAVQAIDLDQIGELRARQPDGKARAG
jgi:hypothetical protein